MGEAPRREFRSDSPVLFAVYLLTYLSVVVRLVLRNPDEGLVGATTYALMAVFLVLGIIQVPLNRRWPHWTHIHLFLQCGVVIALFMTKPSIDYYGVLCVGLAIVAGQDLTSPWDTTWIGVLCVVSVLGLIVAFGPGNAWGYAPVYIAGCILIGMYGRAARKAETARARSEELRGELEEANTRLRAYAAQAEKAAAAQERARLSRELHDAATQTVFSIHLTSEAARIAQTEDPDRLPSLLDRLQELSREALAELRTLVHELRPPAVGEESLVRALERHAAIRERRDNVRVALAVHGEERGSAAAREALLGAAVEALNNVVKHSGVAEAQMYLTFDDEHAVLRVVDGGVGFDLRAARRSESFGLLSMRERVEGLGGTVSVRSAPGQGTEIEIRLPLEREDGKE